MDMNVTTRLYRTYRVATAAVHLWMIYKLPDWFRSMTGREPRTEEEMVPANERASEIVLQLALDLRGVIIKTCQAIATRSDKFPPSFIEKLKQCHDAVPPQSWDVILPAVERELGGPIDQIFSSFDEEPVAAASLAQVHLATLLDGTEVIIRYGASEKTLHHL